MKTAANHLIKLSRSGNLQMLEEAQDKWDRIRKAREAYQFDEGKKKGRVEGLATGLKKGIHQVALNMLKEGADVAFVAKTTKLSKSEIKKLKSKI